MSERKRAKIADSANFDRMATRNTTNAGATRQHTPRHGSNFGRA